MNPEFGLCSSKKGYKNPGPHVRHVTHCILQTALPDARRTPRLRSLLTENAHPVKH